MASLIKNIHYKQIHVVLPGCCSGKVGYSLRVECFETTLTKILSMGPKGLTLVTISQNFGYLFEINEIVANRRCFVSTGNF